MKRPFHIVDVFSAEALAGNQLAVVTDARGLDTASMQAIAREFNFAETSFILPPANLAHNAEVRIFTPVEEMPFAGHPNVGTAFVVASLGTLFGRETGDRLLFEEKAGLVELEILHSADRPVGARCRAPQALRLGPPVDPAIIADLCGLWADDIITERLMPRFASVGAEFLLAEVTAEALERARPVIQGFERHEGRIGQSAGLLGLHLHARDLDHPAEIDARMFAPLSGVAEDPATGSAAAALGAVLHQLEGIERLLIQQGRHIGRPSLIEVDAAVDEVWIGGRCALFATGEIWA